MAFRQAFHPRNSGSVSDIGGMVLCQAGALVGSEVRGSWRQRGGQRAISWKL